MPSAWQACRMRRAFRTRRAAVDRRARPCAADGVSVDHCHNALPSESRSFGSPTATALRRRLPEAADRRVAHDLAEFVDSAISRRATARRPGAPAGAAASSWRTVPTRQGTHWPHDSSRKNAAMRQDRVAQVDACRRRRRTTPEPSVAPMPRACLRTSAACRARRRHEAAGRAAEQHAPAALARRATPPASSMQLAQRRRRTALRRRRAARRARDSRRALCRSIGPCRAPANAAPPVAARCRAR